MHKSDLQDQVVLWMCSDGQVSRIGTYQVPGDHIATNSPDWRAKTVAGIAAARIRKVHTTWGGRGLGAAWAHLNPRTWVIAGGGIHEARRTAPVPQRLAQRSRAA